MITILNLFSNMIWILLKIFWRIENYFGTKKIPRASSKSSVQGPDCPIPNHPWPHLPRNFLKCFSCPSCVIAPYLLSIVDNFFYCFWKVLHSTDHSLQDKQLLILKYILGMSCYGGLEHMHTLIFPPKAAFSNKKCHKKCAKNYLIRMVQFGEKIDRNIFGPNFFDLKHTRFQKCIF